MGWINFFCCTLHIRKIPGVHKNWNRKYQHNPQLETASFQEWLQTKMTKKNIRVIPICLKKLQHNYNLILRTWDRRWKSYTFIHKNLNFLMVPKSSSVKAGILNLELTTPFRESGYFDQVEINLWVITWISKKLLT